MPSTRPGARRAPRHAVPSAAPFSAALAGVLVLWAGGAAAQGGTCTVLPYADQCMQKFPPSQYIDNIVPNAGGTVGCKGAGRNRVQIDVFLFASGGIEYDCSTNTQCRDLPADDEYHQAFCPV